MCCHNIVVILSGGMGERFNAVYPKQYTIIKGKKLLDYSIEEMLKSVRADKILLVLNKDPREESRIKSQYGLNIVMGGKKRADSFKNALDYINRNHFECKKVVFHESARPLVKHEIIDKYFDLLDEYDYVETCKKITDSLGSYVMKAPRREDYYLIQAPEAYRLAILNQYYDSQSDIYFAGNQFPSFVKGYQCFDVVNNYKLTTPEDKALIEYLLS